MTEFVKTKDKRALCGITDIDSPSGPNVSKLNELLKFKIEVLKDSSLFNASLNSIRDNSDTITHIRCLALGSPSHDDAAMFQFAYLKLIANELNVKPESVSLYDPVFTKLDEKFFMVEGYQVEKEYTPQNLNESLYFLPHAELELTNFIIKTERPQILLANNVLTHTERLTKSDLYNKYPLLSKLVKILEQKPMESEDKSLNDFQPVVSKRKNRKSKNKFVEPVLDYSVIESYFTKVKLTSFKKEEEGSWNNAFTDLAYHYLE